jgi:hypothetical protein
MVESRLQEEEERIPPLLFLFGKIRNRFFKRSKQREETQGRFYMQSLSYMDTYATRPRILCLSPDKIIFEMWLLKHTWKTKTVFVRSILKCAIFRIMYTQIFTL